MLLRVCFRGGREALPRKVLRLPRFPKSQSLAVSLRLGSCRFPLAWADLALHMPGYFPLRGDVCLVGLLWVWGRVGVWVGDIGHKRFLLLRRRHHRSRDPSLCFPELPSRATARLPRRCMIAPSGRCWLPDILRLQSEHGR